MTATHAASPCAANLSSIPDQSFNNPQAAAYLGVAPITLAKWRVSGQSPAFYKLNRKVIYLRSDLDAWRAARRRTSTCDEGEGARVSC
jgi:hypothetical protein